MDIIDRAIEEKLKPEGMDSKLFWELFNVMKLLEANYETRIKSRILQK